MLVLKRKVGEAIMIADNIKIIVCPPGRDGHARIGIEAPEHVHVDREEVRRAKEEERKNHDHQNP